MKKILFALALFCSSSAKGDLFGGGATDYLGNGITSQASGSQRPWDVGINVSGVLVDPRTRTWTLLNSTDSVNAVQSGTWTVQQGTPPWSVSQSGTWTTGRTWTLSSGTDSVNAIQGTSPWVNNISQFGGTNISTGTGTGGAGIPRVTISSDSSLTNISGTISLPTGASTSANQTNASQKTQLVDGSGNVIGPVMTVGAVNYLPVSQPVDATSSTINVTTQDIASTTATGFANQSLITGTPTANSAASYSLNSIQTVMVQISGTWTGTLSTEVSEDSGTTWEPRSIHIVGTSTFAASITGNAVGSMNAAAKTNVRIRATAAMTGTAVIKILISDNASNVYVANSIKLVDGSSTPNVNTLTIKAGSVSAASSDTGAVMAIRPDSTIQMFQDRSGTGNITAQCTTPASCPANSTVTATTNGSSSATFNITGTWVGTLLFEGQDGNGNWLGTLGTVPGSGSPTSSTGTNLALTVPSGGFNQIRVRCSSFVSGTIVANYDVGAGLSTLQVFNLTPSAFQTTATQTGTWNINNISGTISLPTGAATASNQTTIGNQTTKLNDGTNSASIKAASTQAALTDTALVITSRPDNVGTPTQTSVSCAGTTTTLLAASTATMFLSIRNPTTSLVTIWINVAGASAVAAAPSMDLPPGAEAYFSAEGSSFLPTSQINCISSGGASSVTLTYK